MQISPVSSVTTCPSGIGDSLDCVQTDQIGWPDSGLPGAARMLGGLDVVRPQEIAFLRTRATLQNQRGQERKERLEPGQEGHASGLGRRTSREVQMGTGSWAHDADDRQLFAPLHEITDLGNHAVHRHVCVFADRAVLVHHEDVVRIALTGRALDGERFLDLHDAAGPRRQNRSPQWRQHVIGVPACMGVTRVL